MGIRVLVFSKGYRGKSLKDQAPGGHRLKESEECLAVSKRHIDGVL